MKSSLVFLTLVLATLVSSCGSGSSSTNSSNVQIPESSGAALSGLTIAGTKTSLNPAFSPDIFRYSVIASDTPSTISVAATAAEDSIISINDAMVASGVVNQLFEVSPGQNVRVSVQESTGLEQNYEIVYLPSDFPELRVTTLTDGVASGPIYLGLRGPESHFVTTIDNRGVPLFYRKLDGRPSNFTRHANGQRSYTVPANEQTPNGRSISEHVILDDNFEEIRRVRTIGLEHTDNHEFLIRSNGNHVFLAYEASTRDLTLFGGDENGLVEDSIVQEVDLNDQVIYEWNSWDRIFFGDALRPHPTEYAHVNSIVFDSDNNAIVSARGTSQVSKIDRSSGELSWTIGGKTNPLTFINDPYSNLCGPHTASVLANGNILIFDNGQYCWPEVPQRGELTRVVEYSVDESARTAELVWSYSQPDAVALSGGSAQRLSNGNTMIGWNRGPAMLATEVDSEGNKVFELTAYTDGVANTSYRALRFDE